MNWSTNINTLSTFPWATEDQYSSIQSHAVMLIAITTFRDDSEHVVEIGVDRGDKIRMLMASSRGFATPSSRNVATTKS